MMKSISCILLVCLLGLMAYAEETQEQQVQRLIGELQDDDFNVRFNAVKALRKIGPGAKDAVPALTQAFRDENKDVRGSAAIALANIGKDAVPTLIELLQDQEWRIRSNAAVALVQIGTPEAIKAAEAVISDLIQALQDQDPQVRDNASGDRGRCGTCSDTSLAGSGHRCSWSCGIGIREDRIVGYGACSDASLAGSGHRCSCSW